MLSYNVVKCCLLSQNEHQSRLPMASSHRPSSGTVTGFGATAARRPAPPWLGSGKAALIGDPLGIVPGMRLAVPSGAMMGGMMGGQGVVSKVLDRWEVGVERKRRATGSTRI